MTYRNNNEIFIPLCAWIVVGSYNIYVANVKIFRQNFGFNKFHMLIHINTDD